MGFRLDGKVALVTGGASGIGAATVRRLAEEGAAVVITDVDEAQGRALAAELEGAGRKALFVPLDVTKEAHWSQAVEKVRATHGALHVLVNNAGIFNLRDLEAETVESFQRMVDINQLGPMLGMKACIPLMKASGGGSIINLSSVAGTIGGTGVSTTYHATKGAVRLMTKSVAIRYAREKIRVNSVHPGYIETPMLDGAMEKLGKDQVEKVRVDTARTTPMKRFGRPEEVAAAIAFLSSDDSSYTTGSEIYVDGGLTAW